MTNPNLWQNFCNAIESAWPASRYRDVGVVIGCSGGADSVALLRCLVQSARNAAAASPPSGFLVVAHFNHRFRGRESNADADFVRQLARQLAVPLETQSGDAVERDEESARNHRRDFFCDVLRRHGARYLALGHSLDDNVETVLHRLMRGTGPAGMAGIASFRPFSDDPSGSDFVIARPMLALGRDQIRDALRSVDYAWREDASNQSSSYRRNWIRNELVPLMQSQCPQAVPAIARAIDGQRLWLSALQPVVERWLAAVQIRENPLTLRRLDQIVGERDYGRDEIPVADQAVAIEALRQCWSRSGWPLRDMGQFHWARVFEMLCGRGPDALTLPAAIEVRRDAHSITLIRRS